MAKQRESGSPLLPDGQSGLRKGLAFLLAFLLSIAPGGPAGAAFALPHGGKVTNGQGTVHRIGNTLQIRQISQSLSLDWSRYDIGANQTVDYLQPGAGSRAFNFVTGGGASTILGHLEANGQVWIMNPFGIVFGKGARVNVGGLVASALSLASWKNGQAVFQGGGGAVSNAGRIRVGPGGTVALVGQNVSNTGTIEALRGTIALGAGNAISLDFTGNALVSLGVNANTAQSIIDSGGMLRADGGKILLTAGAQDSLARSAVNLSGVAEARTVGIKNGQIVLLSGKEAGTTTVSGILDASAPSGGNGGSVEASGNRVDILPGAFVTTAAREGKTGTWLMDPASFYIGMNTGTANDIRGNVTNYEDISGSALATDLNTTNVVIDSTQGAKGTLGNIYVNDAVSWNSGNSLTLNAVNNIQVNAPVTNSGSGNIVLRADDMDIGGVATNTAGGGVPSGVGTVDINTGGSVGTTGSLSITTNPSNYGTVLTNPGTAGGNYANAGTGTVTAYDLLSSNADLYYIDQNQNSTILANNYALNVNITLPTVTSGTLSGADLTQVQSATAANGEIYSSGASTNSNWERFGGSSTPFSGSFDGLGHAIPNLTIDDTVHANVGFIGYFKGSSIQNVGISGGSVLLTSQGDGSQTVGDLVGKNYGTVKYSYATGNVSGSGTGDGTGSCGNTVGGLVGENYGTITDSYATGSVSIVSGIGTQNIT